MWTLKAHYLLWFGSLSGIIPYVSIFAREYLKISSESIGILFLILPFIVSVVKPIICSIADYYKCHSKALLTSQFCMIIGYGLLLFIPILVKFIDSDKVWWIFCLLVLLAHTSNGAGVSLTDYLVMNQVTIEKQNGNESVNFGNYRIWGTIGFGFFGMIINNHY